MSQFHRFLTAQGNVDFRDGDKLRVVVEGYARSADRSVASPWLAIDADIRQKGGTLIPLSGEGVVSVEVIQEPLALGDMVQVWSDVTSKPFYEVVAVKGTHVFLYTAASDNARLVERHEIRRARD